MKTFSPRTLLAVRWERELVELSIVLYRRLRTATGRECAELFTHPKNREIAAQTYLKEKDPYIIHAARVDEHFGFPITTLLCPALNYAFYHGKRRNGVRRH